MSAEAIIVSYKPGARFDLQSIRQILHLLDVEIRQTQLSAKGRIQEQAGKRYFVAGKDRFLLVDGPKTPKMPPGVPITVEAILNDDDTPMELRVLAFKPAA